MGWIEYLGRLLWLFVSEGVTALRRGWGWIFVSGDNPPCLYISDRAFEWMRYPSLLNSFWAFLFRAFVKIAWIIPYSTKPTRDEIDFIHGVPTSDADGQGLKHCKPFKYSYIFMRFLENSWTLLLYSCFIPPGFSSSVHDTSFSCLNPFSSCKILVFNFRCADLELLAHPFAF